eukprot:238209-Amphidinium_carterae.1
MDRRVPVEAEDLEVLGPTFKVGPHLCHRTAGDTRITCKKCERYVTSYKGTWRNLGTLAKQPCKPKARRRKGYEGKAAHNQKGGALPAPPPGARARGRAPGPNKKARVTESLVATTAQSASSLETPRRLCFGNVTPALQAGAPGGATCRSNREERNEPHARGLATTCEVEQEHVAAVFGPEEPGGSSSTKATSQCGLCR